MSEVSWETFLAYPDGDDKFSEPWLLTPANVVSHFPDGAAYCRLCDSYTGSPHHSIHYVRVQTPSRLLSLPWECVQELLARRTASYPTVHPLVEQLRAVGVSRPVDLTDLGDRAFALGVIEGWAAQVGEDELPPGISELAKRVCRASGGSMPWRPVLDRRSRCFRG
jgi:hypothetical protein